MANGGVLNCMPVILKPSKSNSVSHTEKSWKLRYVEWIDWNCNAVGTAALLLLFMAIKIGNKLNDAFASGAPWSSIVQISTGRGQPFSLTLFWSTVLGILSTVFGLAAAISWIALKSGSLNRLIDSGSSEDR